MADYQSYLAASVLADQKLSRSQDTRESCQRVGSSRHSVTAITDHNEKWKRMLFEFHSSQNAKKPGTVRATYLVSGLKRKDVAPKAPKSESMNFDYEDIQSSPYICSSSPTPHEENEITSTLTISLIREEKLDELLSLYEKVDSIHIYSIGSYHPEDLQVLSDITRQTRELCVGEDLLDSAKYGTITNKNVKLRATRRIPPAAAVAPPKDIPLNSKANTAAKSTARSVDKKVNDPEQMTHEIFGKPKPRKSKPVSVSSTPSSDAIKQPKNRGAISKTVTLNTEMTDSAPAPTTSKPTIKRASKNIAVKRLEKDGEGDVIMKDATVKEEKLNTSSVTVEKTLQNDKAREEREAALKKMMEDDNNDEYNEVLTKTDTTAAGDSKVGHAKETSDETSVASCRKRGRRRIMKKVTFKDEEGYLVTKEESAWESFSENEAPPKPKTKNMSTISTNKVKDNTGKVTQGNIMSFFGKKS